MIVLDSDHPKRASNTIGSIWAYTVISTFTAHVDHSQVHIPLWTNYAKNPQTIRAYAHQHDITIADFAPDDVRHAETRWFVMIDWNTLWKTSVFGETRCRLPPKRNSNIFHISYPITKSDSITLSGGFQGLSKNFTLIKKVGDNHNWRWYNCDISYPAGSIKALSLKRKDKKTWTANFWDYL